MEHVKTVCGNERIVLTVKEDNTLWGWSDYSPSQMLFDKTIPRQCCRPTWLENQARRAAIGRDDNFFLAISQGGSLYLVGNDYGEITPYVMSHQRGTKPVNLLERVSDVKIGNHFILIRLEDGRLFSLGENCLGQCGTGRSTGRITKPRLIMQQVTDMVAGHYHGMGLQEDGDLWIWGGDYGISKSRL